MRCATAHKAMCRGGGFQSRLVARLEKAKTLAGGVAGAGSTLPADAVRLLRTRARRLRFAYVYQRTARCAWMGIIEATIDNGPRGRRFPAAQQCRTRSSSMHRMLITGLAAFAGLAGWASPVGAGLFSSTGEAASDVPPSAATLMVTANRKQDRNLRTNGPGKIAELVQSTALPLCNFRHMTQLAVARNWRLASPEQQNALVAEFRTLLVRTYSTALANYRDQAIEYKPLRIASGETEVTVKSTVQQPGAERIAIDYDVEKMTTGWKVYDIRIAGISLIATYQSTFAQTIRDGGVDGLIISLSAKNRQADSGLRSRESGARPFLFMYAVVPSAFRDGR